MDDAGQPRAGALTLPEDSARRAFTTAGADPDALRDAVLSVHADALALSGVDPAHVAEAARGGDHHRGR